MLDFILPVMPWAILCGGILVTLLVSVIRVDTKRPAQIFALLTLGATFLSAWAHLSDPAMIFAGCMEVSPFTHLFLALFSALGIFFILGSSRYLTKENLHLSDYYHLLLILILGAAVLAASKDLVVTFIALEVMSLPAYTLAGFRRNDPRSNEAAIKYYIIGGALGAVFLLGSSFIFGASGSVRLADIYTWSQGSHGDLTLFYVGNALVLIAFLFKVAAVPFHFWKPDVYEGSPTPVTGIMATVITGAAFVTLTRLVHLVDFTKPDWMLYGEVLKHFIRYLAGASLIVGSAIIITQSNLKRMLAYSSISHTGYLLLGLLGTLYQEDQIASVLIYLVAYCLMSCGLFVLLSQSDPKADVGTELVDLTGMMKRAPLTSLLWVVFFFSMAGMPFTVGFFAKYFVFMSSISSGETPLVVIAALCTVVGAYAYLRPVGLMVMRDADPSAATFTGSVVSNAVAVVAALAVVFLGLLPNAMIALLKGIPLIH
jgi:NADH-quinone oxidoreductase subunit N